MHRASNRKHSVMAERLTYRLSFSYAIESLQLLWPQFTEDIVDCHFVVTIAAWDPSGEPLPSSALQAPFSDLLGLPFQYASPSPLGRATPNVQIIGAKASTAEVTILPWGRNSGLSLPREIGPVVAQGSRGGVAHRTITQIREGVRA